MKPIIPTIRPSETETSPEVANLQDALLALLAHDKIWRPDAPGRPTPEERNELSKALQQERAGSNFGETTSKLVFSFQVQQGLGDNLYGVVEDTTAAKLNELLKSIGALDPEPTSFIVRGQIRLSDGSPCAGALVRAYDKDLRSKQLLAPEPVTTDTEGRYEITYTAEQFSRVEKRSADLLVEARQNAEANWIAAPIRFNAQPVEDVDITLDGVYRGPSEFRRHVDEITPRLDGLTMAQLTENSDFQDITFLSNDSGVDRQLIASLAVSALRAQEEDLLHHEEYYGLFRQNLPTDLDVLFEQETDVLRRALENSARDNIVRPMTEQDLAHFVSRVLQLKAGQVLRPGRPNEPASLGDLLGTLPPTEALSNDQQLTFAKLRNEHGDTDNLWKQAEASGLSEAIPALKRTLALDELTKGHTLLVNALQTKLDAMRPESIEFLTALEPIDWTELVFEHGVPPGIGLNRDKYIAQLQADVESKFSMRMLTKQLEKKLIESERFPTRKVLDFFESNPGFDLKTQHVEPYLNETENQDDDSLREGLLQLQRIDVLTASARETGVVLDVGYGSATQIVNEGKPAFELKVANQLSPEQAEVVFAAAEYVVTTVAAIATTYLSPSASGNAVYVLPAPSVSGKKLKEYPSLRSLFDDLGYCECRHCQSVLGPAAYLADLMHFLQRSKLTPNLNGNLEAANLWLWSSLPYLELEVGRTVLGALLQRRPDLADLELSCENTDTKIPYIDLVLEILENAVALPVLIENVAGIDINAEFAGGRVPVEVTAALRKTAIKIGKTLTVSDSPYQDPSNPLSISDWIITDGSRRWSVKHLKHQFLFRTSDGLFERAQDITGAVDSLKNGTLSAELKDRLSPGLPIDGAPQIQIVQTDFFAGIWIATYIRAIAIKITMGSDMGAVQLLKLDGTPLRAYQFPLGMMQIIVHAFTSGATTTINQTVARWLEFPANETYLQTWNPTQNWWELSVTNTAVFIHVLERLAVSGLTYQNSSIREHLTSSSENRNPVAYDILSKNAVYPWALPFDLWLEETRAFLDALGIPRAQLVDIARTQARLSEEAAALELLGLSKSEADLITPAAAPNDPWIYWGLAQENNIVQDHTAGSAWKGNWQEVLAHLSMLLQQSGLSYREYLDFMQTSFVGQSKPTLFPPNECKTSQIFLIGLNELDFTDHLNRIHVFTRLWRKLGWSMQDLDLALMAFAQPWLDGQVTPTSLQGLALLKRLQTALGLPVRILVGCIHTLETTAWTDHTKDGSPVERALYDRIFQRQSLRSLPGFEDFALGKVNLSTRISDPPYRADFVAASLGIKPEQLKAWINGTSNLGMPNADYATMDTLSCLYTAASLCRVLQIAPEAMPEIVTLLGMTAGLFGGVPVGSNRAQIRGRALLEFVERINFVRKSGFDFETLSYLLRHKVLPGAANDVSTKIEQQLTKTLTELRSALQAGVVLGNVSADNVRRQLARLGWYPSLIDEAMGSDGFNHQPGASVEISPPQALTPEPLIPLNLRSKFTYQKGSPLYSVDDLKDLTGLVAKFSSLTADPLSAYLWNRIPAASQNQVQDPTLSIDQRSSVLVDILNTIIMQGVKIYDATRFSGITLSSETIALVAQNPTGPDLVRLNGILLAEAYPLEITRNQAVLKCTGSLINSDFASIKNLNLFPEGKVTDLETKYEAQLVAWTKALASLLQIMALQTIPTVTEALTGLTALPVIPGQFKDRLKLEVSSTSATEGNLKLTGWLSDADKQVVTEANPSLSAAVNSLQAKALLEIPAPTPPQTLLEAEQLLREPDVEKRYRSILLRLISRLELDLLVAQLSGALGADPPVVSTLLDSVKVNAKAMLTDSSFLGSDPTPLSVIFSHPL